MEKDGKIYVAGHTGLFGRTTLRMLRERGYERVLCRTHQELDLTRQADVERFFQTEQPEYVFMMCGKVGGIQANAAHMAEFTIENLKMNANIIEAAHRCGVKKLLYLGSSCMYPRLCPQPARPEYLLTGEIEPTNEGYALAKLLGLRLCAYYRRQYGDNFIACIPANVYGPGDHWNEADSHVVPALLSRFHRAARNGDRRVVIWGSGRAEREFLYIDDAVSACLRLMEEYDGEEPVNIGTGVSVSIRVLAEEIRRVTGYAGELYFDTGRPDGMPLRRLDSEAISAMGWRPEVSLREGLERTCESYLNYLKSLPDLSLPDQSSPDQLSPDQSLPDQSFPDAGEVR